MIDCNFLALSATINNVDYLAKKLVEMKPKHKIKYIEYTKRFINHQRWVWKNEGLKKLHPLCVFDSIDDEYNESNLSFTPNDCSTIWEKISIISSPKENLFKNHHHTISIHSQL